LAEKDRPLNHSRSIDDDQTHYVRTDELKQIRTDRVSDQELFIGRAVAQDVITSEALWQIQRITNQSSGDEVKEFVAKGAYNQVWDDRATLFPGFTPGTGVVGGSVVFEPSAGPFTDRSGTATTVTSVVAAANTQRKYFFIKNLGSGEIWIDFGVAAIVGQPSVRLDAGEKFELNGGFIVTQAINVIAKNATKDFAAKEG